MKALRKRVETELEALGWWRGGGRLVGIGGTIRNLAVAAMRRAELPLDDVQGFALERDALEELIELLADRPASKRGELRGIKPDRGDVILGGALVLAAGARQRRLRRHRGDRGGPARGGLLRAAARRARAVRRRAARVGGEPRAPLQQRARARRPRGGAVARDVRRARAPPACTSCGDAERELLWAACVLHDIGTAIDYDDHHRHSHYLILNAGLPGFDPRELVLVGLIARYHRKGDPDASELGDLAQPRRRRAAAPALRDHPAGRAARAQPRRRDPRG